MKRFALHELVTRGDNIHAALYEHVAGMYCLHEEAATVIAEKDAEIAVAIKQRVRLLESSTFYQEQLHERDTEIVCLTIKHEVACSTIALLQDKCDVRGKALALQCDETKALQEQLRASNEALEKGKRLLREQMELTNERTEALIAAQPRRTKR